MPRRFAPLTLLALLLMASPAAHADTSCSFGGPTPGFRAMRMNLPAGSDFLTISFTSTRPTMVAGDRSSWHLSEGIGVIDEATHELIAWKVMSQGNSPRRAVVEADGTDVARQEFTGPDAPFVRQSSGLVPSLPPGTYDIVAFGTDGDARLPNPWWGGEVKVSASIPCTPLGDGDVFDHDQTEFHGGTQVAAWGAGVAQAEHYGFTTSRHLVFGLLDVATELAGSATLDYTLPDRPDLHGEITNKIIPFVSSAGGYSFDASYAGSFPLVSIDGVAVDLP